MTCIELQDSLAEIENGTSTEQLEHLNTCPHCSALVRELSLIASSAVELRDAEEPSPRVWNSIQIALRREGLIHDPRPSRPLLPSISDGWFWARWALPVATALLIVSLYFRPHPQPSPIGVESHGTSVSAPDSELEIAGLRDEDLLQEISQQAPALQAQYADNLRRVNQSIQDAKGSVEADPNDGDARRSLMDAYQQKAMLFELAMDRSLP